MSVQKLWSEFYLSEVDEWCFSRMQLWEVILSNLDINSPYTTGKGERLLPCGLFMAPACINLLWQLQAENLTSSLFIYSSLNSRLHHAHATQYSSKLGLFCFIILHLLCVNSRYHLRNVQMIKICPTAGLWASCARSVQNQLNTGAYVLFGMDVYWIWILSKCAVTTSC